MNKLCTVGPIVVLVLLLCGSSGFSTTIVKFDYAPVFHDLQTGLYWYNTPYAISADNEYDLQQEIDHLVVTSTYWIWDEWELATQQDLSDLLHAAAQAGDGDFLFTGWKQAADGEYYINGHTSSSAMYLNQDVKLSKNESGWYKNSYLTFATENGGAFIVSSTVKARSPVPEPSSALLFGLGTILVWQRRRKPRSC